MTYNELTNQKIASKVQRKVVSSMTASALDAQLSMPLSSSSSSLCHYDRAKLRSHSFPLSMIIKNCVVGGKWGTNHSFLAKVDCYHARGVAFVT